MGCSPCSPWPVATAEQQSKLLPGGTLQDGSGPICYRHPPTSLSSLQLACPCSGLASPHRIVSTGEYSLYVLQSVFLEFDYIIFFWGIFFFFLFVQYSALLHLPPLRFHCADGCWDRTQDRCNLCIGSQTL